VGAKESNLLTGVIASVFATLLPLLNKQKTTKFLHLPKLRHLEGVLHLLIEDIRI